MADNKNLCRICGDQPASDDGVCRWESCEAEAAGEIVVPKISSLLKYREDYESVNTHELKEGDIVVRHGGIFRLKDRSEWPAYEDAIGSGVQSEGGVVVAFHSDLIAECDDGCDIPKSWLPDWRIQGNGLAQWARLLPESIKRNNLKEGK